MKERYSGYDLTRDVLGETDKRLKAGVPEMPIVKTPIEGWRKIEREEALGMVEPKRRGEFRSRIEFAAERADCEVEFYARDNECFYRYIRKEGECPRKQKRL